MKNILLVTALAFTHAAVINAQNSLTQGYILFEYRVSAEEGKKETVRKQYDSIEYNKLKAFSPDLTESILKLSRNSYDSVSLYLNTRLKTKIWFSNDTIFRKDSIADDQMFEQIKAYNHFDGKELKYIEGLPLYTLDSTNIFVANKSKQFIFKVDRSLRRMILGYDCYKIYLKIIDTVKKDTQFINLYVTDKIRLPIHVLIPSNEMYNQYFPLEIEVLNNDIPGHVITIKAIDIQL
jgi:hypothetical protein